MKKSKLSFFVLMISIIVVFGSCKKDKDPVNDTAKMEASVDGSNWTAKETQAAGVNGILNITGLTESGSLISITLQSLETGTYTLDNTSLHVAAYTEDQSGSVAFTTNGSADSGGEVVISEISNTDSTISGTFSFTVYRAIDQQEKSITGGTFTKVKYTPPPPNMVCDGNGEDTYMPFAEGNLWHYYSSVNMGDTEHKFIGMETLGSKQYYMVQKTWYPLADVNHAYYRFDDENNLYVWRTDIDDNMQEQEVLLIPANPTVGQTWDNPMYDTYYKIQSLSASFTTKKCNYTGLLEIHEFREGELYKKSYYKKGIGLVNARSYGAWTSDNYLGKVVLN